MRIALALVRLLHWRLAPPRCQLARRPQEHSSCRRQLLASRCGLLAATSQSRSPLAIRAPRHGCHPPPRHLRVATPRTSPRAFMMSASSPPQPSMAAARSSTSDPDRAPPADTGATVAASPGSWPTWTVCLPCRGLGQLPHRSSGKRRRNRHRQARQQQQQQQQQQRGHEHHRQDTNGTSENVDRGGMDDDEGGRGTAAAAYGSGGRASPAPSSASAAAAAISRGPILGRRCEACEGTGIVLSNEKAPSISLSPPPPPPPPPGSSRNWDVAIVGGGLAGLALHVALNHRGIASTVYERDANFDARHQGYGLTLQQSSRALSSFGIRGDSPLPGAVASTKHVVHSTNGAVLGSWGYRQWGRAENRPPPKRQNVHVARQALRRALLQACGGDAAVQWNHKLIQYRRRSADDPETSQEMVLTFQVRSGSEPRVVERGADFVVGADGIRSMVRDLLLSHNNDGTNHSYPLRYLGCLVVLGICPLDDATRISLSSDLLDGETVFQTADGTTRLYMMPFSPTAYMWQLSFPVDESVASAISREGPAKLLRTAMERCGRWHAPIPGILERTPSEMVSGYPVYDRAPLSADDLASDPRVTLIGDACHPMSPFKGQGANQALLDALALARCLYVGTGVVDFEREMLERSSVKVQASADAAKFLHSDVCLKAGNVTRGGAAAATSGSTAL